MSMPSFQELEKKFGKYWDDKEGSRLSEWTEENHDDTINEEEYLNRGLNNIPIFEKKFRQVVDSIGEKKEK